MPHHGSGYRLSLCLQYSGSEDVSFRDSYLQLAYQYRANTLVYGIGVVSHAGATLEVFASITAPAFGGFFVVGAFFDVFGETFFFAEFLESTHHSFD